MDEDSPTPESFRGESDVKNLPAMQETQVQSLDQEDPLEEGKATTPVFLQGELHGQRSPEATAHSVTKSQTQLTNTYTLTHTHSPSPEAALLTTKLCCFPGVRPHCESEPLNHSSWFCELLALGSLMEQRTGSHGIRKYQIVPLGCYGSLANYLTYNNINNNSKSNNNNYLSGYCKD